MNVNIYRWHRLAAAIVLLMLTCGTPSHAWCASANLWIGFFDGGGIESYTSGQLNHSGTPTPIYLNTFRDVLGIAFDKSHNLWATANGDEVVEFTAAQLKDLKSNPSPTPPVIITSTSTFSYIQGCNFDKDGNLWMVDADKDSIDELSEAQLKAGSANVTPAIVITSSDLNYPNFLIFDKAGDAWVDSSNGDTIAKFSASQLTSSGSKSPAVLISSTSFDGPGEIAFDGKRNLWVPNGYNNTVVEFKKDQLTSSGSLTPAVTLTSAVFDDPWGAVFNSKGDLLIANYDGGTIATFTPTQLKASGAPVPAVSVTAISPGDFGDWEMVFGPAY